MTIAVPTARETGMSRLGFFTSPAVNVMLFQASAEKSDPTCETPKAINKPNAPDAAVTDGMNDFIQDAPGSMVCGSCSVQMPVKLAWIAAALRPRNIPARISAASPSNLAEVKTF